MLEHSRDHHGGVVGDNDGLNDYKMSVKNKFVRCLDRQVFEDVRMQHCLLNGGTLLEEWVLHTQKWTSNSGFSDTISGPVPAVELIS